MCEWQVQQICCVPFMSFSDPLFKRGKTWRLSTSNITTPYISYFAFGAVIPDGVRGCGCGYSLWTSFFSSWIARLHARFCVRAETVLCPRCFPSAGSDIGYCPLQDSLQISVRFVSDSPSFPLPSRIAGFPFHAMAMSPSPVLYLCPFST